MIKCQLNITSYEKISLYSIRFDISLSQACCRLSPKIFLAFILFLNETFNEILKLNPKGSAPKRGGRYQCPVAPELPKCPMEKCNAPELGVLYYYKHFLKILCKLVKKL
jgi:hypothetical protein